MAAKEQNKNEKKTEEKNNQGTDKIQQNKNKPSSTSKDNNYTR